MQPVRGEAEPLMGRGPLPVGSKRGALGVQRAADLHEHVLGGGDSLARFFDELTGPRVSEGAEQRREDPAIMVVRIDDGPADECVGTGRPRKVVEELYSRGPGPAP